MSLIVALLIAAAPIQGANAGTGDCAKFLVGHWVGKGQVDGFGKPMQVEADYRFEATGRFRNSTRYQGTGGRWTSQTITGTWGVTRGKAARECTLTLTGSGASAGSQSTSTITQLDAMTFRSLGFDMKRVK